MAAIIFVLLAIIAVLLILRPTAYTDLQRTRVMLEKIISDLESGKDRYRQSIVARLKALL